MKSKQKQLKKAETKALSIAHPNSRKAKKLSKQIIRDAAKHKSKVDYAIKRNVFGEKLIWFRDHLNHDSSVYSGKMLEELVDRYLGRFDHELEQIEIKHSIGQRKNRQHASREDIIKMTKSRETDEFNNGGIEIIDLLNPKQMELLKNWTGNLNEMPKFKVVRYSRSFLQKHKTKNLKCESSPEEKNPEEVVESMEAEGTSLSGTQTSTSDLGES